MALRKIMVGLAAMTIFLMAPAFAEAESPGFLHSKYPNKVHAAQTTTYVLTITGSEVKCTTESFDSTTKTGPTTELTATPTYSGCTAFGLPATVAANGCTYRFAQPEGSEDNWNGGFAIKCPEGKKIVITANSIFGTCIAELGEQTPTGTVSYENDTFGTGIELAFSFSVIKDKVATSTGVCPLTVGEHANATYSGGSYAEGLEGGLLAIGEFETEDPVLGKFLHSKYPNKVHAAQTTTYVLTITGSEVKCTTESFDSTTKTGPTTELTATPTYSGCTAFGLPATIAANGCTYRLAQPEGAEDNWKGTFAIKCPEGKKIVITATSKFGTCVAEIGEQTPTGSVSYENDTFGTGIKLAFSFSAIKDKVATSTGVCPLTVGEHTNASYSGGSYAEGLEGGLLAIG